MLLGRRAAPPAVALACRAFFAQLTGVCVTCVCRSSQCHIRMSEGSRQVQAWGSSASIVSSRKTLKSHLDKSVKSEHITLTEGKLWHEDWDPCRKKLLQQVAGYFIYTYMYIHIYTCMYMYIYVYIYIYIYICTYMCVYKYIHIHVLCIHTYIHVCIYIYIYMCIYLCIHTYIHTYIIMIMLSVSMCVCVCLCVCLYVCV
jgi:hypothetical protein